MRPNLPTILSVTLLGLVAETGCKPTYPKCETDEHSAEKGEVCVTGSCQECREDTQCVEKYDETHECEASKCEVKPACRTDGDCASVGEGLVCRSNKCVPECTETTDCPTGMKCEDQKCIPECETDAECTPGQSCNNGMCTEPVNSSMNISAACRSTTGGGGDLVELITIPFDFNEFDIRVDARQALDQNASCLQEVSGQLTIVLEGHADERGSQEYNLALGEKRANAVRNYLRNLGVEANVMTTRSMGENRPSCRQNTDDCHQQNRRVEFIQRVSN